MTNPNNNPIKAIEQISMKRMASIIYFKEFFFIFIHELSCRSRVVFGVLWYKGTYMKRYKRYKGTGTRGRT